MVLFRWLRALRDAVFRSRHLDAELDAELRSAVDELAARYQHAGASRELAERRARMALGGVQQVRERTRDVRPGIWFEALMVDVRYAARTLKVAPGFSLTVIATFALAIGANSAIFSVVKQLLLEPLPYRDAERLVFIWSDLTAAGYPRAPLAGPELKDLRERATLVEGFGAIWSNTAAITDGDEPEQLKIGLVTVNFFSVLGREPALGRDFRLADEEPGATPAIMLSWELWQRRFGSDPAVVGSQIEVNGVATTVVGVMPSGFRLWFPLDASVPDDLQAWRPFARAIQDGSRGQQYLRVIGRLRPHVTVQQASDEVFAIGRQIGRAFQVYGSTPPSFSAVALHDDSVRDVRSTVVAVFVGVSLLLLLAAVNVANLFIARASGRRPEIAMRLSLGASRTRLLQQCLAEGALLGLLGGGLGILVAAFVLDVLIALRPSGLERLTPSVDAAILMLTLASSLVWGLVVSLAPFLAVVRKQTLLNEEARSGAGRVTSGRSEFRTRAGLVTLQVAISFALIVAAGLLARTYVNLNHVDLGFDTREALTFRLALPPARYRSPQEANAFQAAFFEALSVRPDVTAVAGVSHLPFDGIPNWSTPYLRVDAPPDTVARDADARTITPGFFAAMGTTLIEGREFSVDDERGKVPVAVVDERLAARTWPGESAVGQQLRTDPGASGTANAVVIVVGVVRHVRHRSPGVDVREQIYFPQRQVLRNPLALVVRTDDLGRTALDVKAAVASLDPRLPIYDVHSLGEYINRAKSVQRFIAVLAAAFSATAVLLATVGMYGVLAFSVVRRRRELAIRLAVGAQPRAVRGLVLAEAARLGTIGLFAGALCAMALAELLRSQLYQVSPYDPGIYLSGLVVVALGMVLAMLGPGRRAAGVHALESLRTDIT